MWSFKDCEIQGAYYDMWVDDLRSHVGHVLVHHLFGFVFDGKNIGPPHQVMCAISFEKVAKHPCLTDFAWFGWLWWSSRPYAQSYLQNILMAYVFVKDIKKSKENAWNITLYQTWPRWLFIDGVLYLFAGVSFYACSIPLRFPHHFPPLPI